MKLWKCTSSEILYCEKVSVFRKKLLWKNSSPEKVDVRSIAFLKTIAASKSSTSGKVAVLKRCLFWRGNFVEKAAILKILMFCKSVSFRKEALL